MQVSRYWRQKEQLYQLIGCRWSDGSVHFPPRPEPVSKPRTDTVPAEPSAQNEVPLNVELTVLEIVA